MNCGQRFLVAMGILAMVAVLVPNFKRARCEMTPERSCWGAQKALAGAAEMWHLDRPGPMPFDEALARRMVAEGYLHSIPHHPTGPDRFPWIVIDVTGRLGCPEHGPVAAVPARAPPTNRAVQQQRWLVVLVLLLGVWVLEPVRRRILPPALPV